MDDQAELEALGKQLGRPRVVHVDLKVGSLFDPVVRTDRHGEVAFLLQRSDARLWLMTKEFYPPGAYRVPTGGVKLGEPIDAALARELAEETGAQAAPSRFLAAIRYHLHAPRAEATFATYLFLVPWGIQQPESQDPEERIADWRLVALEDLPGVAAGLAGLPRRESPEFGNWQDWGRFRAVVHRTAYEALSPGRGDAGTKG